MRIINEIKKAFIKTFSMKNIKQEKNIEYQEKISNTLTIINAQRTIPLAITLFIVQLFYLIKDLIVHYTISPFYEGLKYLNLVSQILILIFYPLLIFLMAYYLSFEKRNYKKITINYMIIYIVFLISFVLYAFSNLFYSGSFSGIIVIIIVFMIVPMFNNGITNFIFFLGYFIPISLFGIYNKYSINITADYEISSLIMIMLGSFLVSSYVRINNISKEYNELLLSQANEKLQLLSTTDQLTSANNRRGMEYYIYSSLPKWLKNKSKIALYFIDVDEFKRFNDSYLHIKGDWCLKEVANCVFEATKEYKNLFSRYGGDEFCIYVEGMNSEDEVIKLGMSLLNKVREKNIIHGRKAHHNVVSISIGVSFFEVLDSEEFNEESKRADLEVFNAKKNGRDCMSYKGVIYK